MIIWTKGCGYNKTRSYGHNYFTYTLIFNILKEDGNRRNFLYVDIFYFYGIIRQDKTQGRSNNKCIQKVKSYNLIGEVHGVH